DAFLFDEPLSNLDAKLRGQMRTQIAQLQRQLGITSVYVTHDQTEAMTLGDRVAVLKKGRLQQVASPRELYERPVHLSLASVVGPPSVDCLPARMVEGRLATPIGTLELPEGVLAAPREWDLAVLNVRPEYFEDMVFADEARDRDGTLLTA